MDNIILRNRGCDRATSPKPIAGIDIIPALGAASGALGTYFVGGSVGLAVGSGDAFIYNTLKSIQIEQLCKQSTASVANS